MGGMVLTISRKAQDKESPKCFYRKSTNATGMHKNAEFLYQDIKGAIAEFGGDGIVFIVVLDGPSVCKTVLALIDERGAKIFGQRCSTHGWQTGPFSKTCP